MNDCNYNVNEAITKYNNTNTFGIAKEWSVEENDAFEEGYKEYGKDFRKIQEKMVFFKYF